MIKFDLQEIASRGVFLGGVCLSFRADTNRTRHVCVVQTEEISILAVVGVHSNLYFLFCHSFLCSKYKDFVAFRLFIVQFIPQVKSVNHKQKKASILFIDNPKIYTRKG